jgi:hypothetical protein
MQHRSLAHRLALALSLCSMLCMASTQSHAKELPDSEIRAILIKQSIASYSGNCTCPRERAVDWMVPGDRGQRRIN